VEELKRTAAIARREHPTPEDFDMTLHHYNLRISSLKPHLRHPIPKEDLFVEFYDPLATDEEEFITRPLLEVETADQARKQEMAYIPKPFPEFPSVHTYRYTPREDSDPRNPKKIREEAARAAKQGEEALRGLVRAAKIRQQKEARVTAERDVLRRERHGLWEGAMKGLMESGENAGEWEMKRDMSRTEIADHSMIVNMEGVSQRREVVKSGRKALNATEAGIVRV
jgi:transcription initiation factor TFIID subunit 8